MTLKRKAKGVYTDDSRIEILTKTDAIIFDCDGVLIDITQSYDMTTAKTVLYVLENMANIHHTMDIDYKIIDGFKSTGGFNDDVDVAYAAIISIVAAEKLGRDPTGFIFEVIKNSDSDGITSAQKYIESLVDITDIRELLSYPGEDRKSPLYDIFDQIFYGSKLYRKLFHTPPDLETSGLINRDDIILNHTLIDTLQKRFGCKIAMVTGRGLGAVRHSLKSLLTGFDLSCSMFLEDEPRHLAKPNPQSLLHAINGMNSNLTLYVGDSMEDLIMAQRATELGHRTVFCGILGTSKNPLAKLELFERNGVILALDSINNLPKVLNLE